MIKLQRYTDEAENSRSIGKTISKLRDGNHCVKCGYKNSYMSRGYPRNTTTIRKRKVSLRLRKLMRENKEVYCERCWMKLIASRGFYEDLKKRYGV